MSTLPLLKCLVLKFVMLSSNIVVLSSNVIGTSVSADKLYTTRVLSLFINDILWPKYPASSGATLVSN